MANLFFDWNPLYADYITSKGFANVPFVPSGEDPSLFAKLISDAKKLQVCFFRHSGLVDRDLSEICRVLKPEAGMQMNRNLKVLDLSYNTFKGECVQEFASVFEVNRNLEFVGLAKNNLTSEDVLPLLKFFGRVPFPSEKVAQHQQELKARDLIVEKNKKLKAQKKPEEMVPVLDNLESEVHRDESGADVTVWYMVRNPQFKHLNLCLNQIDDSIMDRIEEVLMNTSDDFGITMSGNPITASRVKDLHAKIERLHKKRYQEALRVDPSVQPIEDIAQKRFAF